MTNLDEYGKFSMLSRLGRPSGRALAPRTEEKETTMTTLKLGEPYRLPFENCRNITSAHDQAAG
ncbi:MAG TPA: hypothetical protein VLA50_04600, partial [Erythrobacter sp.]|nr:hypothetical protein [Erythrobacter sp.]